MGKLTINGHFQYYVKLPEGTWVVFLFPLTPSPWYCINLCSFPSLPAHPKTAAGCLVIRQYECPIPGKDSQRGQNGHWHLWTLKENLESSNKTLLLMSFSHLFPRDIHSKKTAMPCSNPGHLPGFVATNFSCTSLLVGFAANIGPAPKRFDTDF